MNLEEYKPVFTISWVFFVSLQTSTLLDIVDFLKLTHQN